MDDATIFCIRQTFLFMIFASHGRGSNFSSYASHMYISSSSDTKSTSLIVRASTSTQACKPSACPWGVFYKLLLLIVKTVKRKKKIWGLLVNNVEYVAIVPKRQTHTQAHASCWPCTALPKWVDPRHHMYKKKTHDVGCPSGYIESFSFVWPCMRIGCNRFRRKLLRIPDDATTYVPGGAIVAKCACCCCWPVRACYEK
jgi:hypothetical protein